jgi:NTE family protein
VEIDGQAYWDGGFAANPAVFPLVCDCAARDVLLVLLAPLERAGTPRTREEIDARVAELAFSTHFMREMALFARATALARPGFAALGRLERRLRQMRWHMIDNRDLPDLARTDTKALAYGPFLERLRAQGQDRGAAWRARHGAAVGRQSSVDVAERFG